MPLLDVIKLYVLGVQRWEQVESVENAGFEANIENEENLRITLKI